MSMKEHLTPGILIHNLENMILIIKKQQLYSVNLGQNTEFSTLKFPRS